MFTEEEYVQIAALQHFVFCPRQCALIHTERAWAENAHTILGKQEHGRVDSAKNESRGCVYTSRSVSLISHQLGIKGVSDVVEYRQTADGELVYPVEYKHGRPKKHLADVVQLCAQALCLEEMHQCHIPEGYIFYQSQRRRYPVKFDEDLRRETEIIIRSTRELLQSGNLPSAARRKECDSCSLFDLCLPLSDTLPITEYNNRRFNVLISEQ